MSKEYEKDFLYEPKTMSENMDIILKDYYTLYAKDINGTITPNERVRFKTMKITLGTNKNRL